MGSVQKFPKSFPEPTPSTPQEIQTDQRGLQRLMDDLKKPTPLSPYSTLSRLDAALDRLDYLVDKTKYPELVKAMEGVDKAFVEHEESLARFNVAVTMQMFAESVAQQTEKQFEAEKQRCADVSGMEPTK